LQLLIVQKLTLAHQVSAFDFLQMKNRIKIFFYHWRSGNIWLIPDRLIIFVFITIGFLIYSNTLNSPFVLDDTNHITNNPNIRLISLNVEGIKEACFLNDNPSRPLPRISFALNYYVHRYDVAGYHLFNIFIHITTGILLFYFIRYTLSINRQSNTSLIDEEKDNGLSFKKKTSQQWVSLFAALLWLVHPLQTQSVNYIVQRMNSMAAMFSMLSFLLYIIGRTKQRYLSSNKYANIQLPANKRQDNWIVYLLYTGSLLSGIMAFASKETAIILPCMMFIYEWFFFQDLSFVWLKRYLTLVVALFTALYILIFLYLGDHPVNIIFAGYNLYDFTLTQRVLTEFRVVIFYLSLMIWPHPFRLNFDHDFALSYSLFNPIFTLISLTIIIAFIIFSVWIAKKNRIISFGILWFFGNLLIESSVLPIEIIYEHRTYLPSMLIYLIFVIYVFKHIRYNWIKYASMTLIMIALCIWTYERNSVWFNTNTLWADCVKKSPQSVRSLGELGRSLYIGGNYLKAEKILVKAINLDPSDWQLFVHMGNISLIQGKLDQAISYYDNAITISPTNEDAFINKGAILVSRGKNMAALHNLEKALQINYNNEKTHFNLGRLYFNTGNKEKTIFHYKEALRINPGYQQAKDKLIYLKSY